MAHNALPQNHANIGEGIKKELSTKSITSDIICFFPLLWTDIRLTNPVRQGKIQILGEA